MLEIVPTGALSDHCTAVLLVPCTLAVNCCDPPATRFTEEGTTVTLTAGAVSPTVATPDFDASATLVAFTVTAVPEAIAAGAVYNPLDDTVPTLALPPLMPFTLQVTPVDCVPVTTDVNCWVRPGDKLTDAGDTLTATVALLVLLPGATETRAEADLVESATACAVTVIDKTDEALAGAVYTPLPEIVPTTAEPPAIPFTFQTTLESSAPVTDA